MPELWVYVLGGVILGIIVLTIAYNLLSTSMTYAQKQDALQEFSNLVDGIEKVCAQEVNNSLLLKISLPRQVRVVYTTNEEKILPTVFERIKNEEMSEGRKICLQFKDEDFLRCSQGEFYCNIRMPYLGVLPEKEDIFVAVNKILGKGVRRDYTLLIKKIKGREVEISVQ